MAGYVLDSVACSGLQTGAIACETDPTCAAGYEGTPTESDYSCGAEGAELTIGGCTEVVCTQPADITGYTVTDTQLNVVTGFDVTPACATGYEGTAAVSACTASGDYTLSGCTAIVCTQPADITGYTVTEAQLNVATGFDVTVECDAATHSEHGHEDVSAAAIACTTSGPYTLRGCTCSDCVCVTPDTTGYVIIGSNLGGAGSVFDIHADTCAPMPSVVYAMFSC